MNPRLNLLLAATALLGSSAPATAQFDTPDHKTYEFFNPTGTLPPVQRIESGHLFGVSDSVADLVVLFGDRAMVLQDPGSRQARYELPTSATQLAVWPSATSGDLILTVGPTGLHSWQWNGSTFFDRAENHNQTYPIWVAAKQVACADLDGNGVGDVFGVGSDGRQVLLSTDINQPWATAQSFTLGPMIQSIRAIQWNDDAALELVMRTPFYMVVTDLLGTVLYFDQIPDGGGLLAVVDDPSSSRQLALVFKGGPASPTQFLETRGRGITPSVLDLGVRTVAAIEVGQLNASSDSLGVQDLVLSFADAPELGLFSGALGTGGVSFTAMSPTPLLAVRSPAGPTGPAPMVHLVDLDGDGELGNAGDLDMVYSPNDRNEVVMYFNEDRGHDAYSCQWTETQVGVDALDELYYILNVNRPLAGIWDRILVSIWRLGRFDYLTASAPHAEFSVPLSGNLAEIRVDTMRSTWFQDIYFLELRPAIGPASAPTLGPSTVLFCGLGESLSARRDLYAGQAGDWTLASWIGAVDFDFAWDYVPVEVAGIPNPLFPINPVAFNYGGSDQEGPTNPGGGSGGGPILPPFPPGP